MAESIDRQAEPGSARRSEDPTAIEVSEGGGSWGNHGFPDVFFGAKLQVVSLPRCRELSAKAFEAATHACVDAQRARLEDDASDQVGVHAPRRVDGAARCLFDLADDLTRIVVGEVVRGRQLDREPSFLLRHQPLELALDLADLSAAVLLHGK